MAVMSAYGNKHRNGYHVVSASKEDGVSATLMGGGGGVIYRPLPP